jgi:iron(II)-dependent oxidoreductase
MNHAPVIALVSALGARQRRLLEIATSVPPADLYRQYHPDLSPIAWHLGHCAFIEAYWLREQVRGDATHTHDLHHLYFPEQSPKGERAARLPDHARLFAFASRLFGEHGEMLRQPEYGDTPHTLMEDNYLILFLQQHIAQHIETVMQILQQRLLREAAAPECIPASIAACDVYRNSFELAGGVMQLGHPGGAEAYDNELPRHEITLRPFALARRPVTNAEFLGFMRAGGYTTDAFWSMPGRRWRDATRATQPEPWRCTDGCWYAVTPDGAEPLVADGALSGVSWFEAEAYAHYAQARLPHEAEWEFALRQHGYGALAAGDVWEWCSNDFYPYPGFHAFPYDGYSLPWFDRHHRVLRGGSRYTDDCIKRPSFRNFHTPGKRHIFGGLRLAWDLPDDWSPMRHMR